MAKIGTLYRQGDVLLRRVASIPAKAKEVARDNGRLILAYGEVTGHAHVIDAPPSVAVMVALSAPRPASPLTIQESATFVRLAKKAQLVHEEHGTITLEPGDYEVVRQREYTAWGERRVAD
jgi:hypothetical protein